MTPSPTHDTKHPPGERQPDGPGRADAAGRDGTRRIARHAVVIGTVGIVAAYASAFASPAVAAWGPWVLAVALPVVMVATMTLGAVRAGGRLGTLAVPFAFVLLVVAGGFLAALALPPDGPGDPLVLGLPLRAAVILYGVGVLPLFVLPVAYAVTFASQTLSEADLARVRAARRGGARPGDAPRGHA